MKNTWIVSSDDLDKKVLDENTILICLDSFLDNTHHVVVSKNGEYVEGSFTTNKQEAYRKFNEYQLTHLGEIKEDIIGEIK